MNSITSSRAVSRWLLSGCALIFCMVVIGGITRLTGSGLSITEWNVIMGTLPPMNDQAWQDAFVKYQAIPQFKEVNSHFRLEDFKSIFWWEYIHRLVGRLIGVVFILPFIWFLIRKQLDASMIRKALFLFALGGLQGFLGWFMVKSGLADRTSVSHIRLAIHLTTAFITFGFTYWFALQLAYPRAVVPVKSGIKSWANVLTGAVILQLIYGAFVAGLHAGQMHNTFPLMNGTVFPDNGWVGSWGLRNVFDNPTTVQFLHRFFAFTLLFLVGMIVWKSRQQSLAHPQLRAVRFLLLAVSVQFILGVLTILYQAPLALSAIHQAGAFFLFMSVLFLRYQFTTGHR